MGRRSQALPGQRLTLTPGADPSIAVMTNTHAMNKIAELTTVGGALDLGPDASRLLLRMLRLLASGTPVTRQTAEHAAADRGIDPSTARQLLDAWTERDEDGDIVGLGITYNPTPHQITIDGHQMWAWCALDTLIFAVALDRAITVESAAPDSDQTVHLRVSPDGITDIRPDSAVVTWPARDNDQVDISSTTAIWGTFCHHSYFFPTRTDAQRWATSRDDIEILTLDEGFAIARELATAVFLRYES